MTFWKRLRLIGSAIVLVLAVVAAVGAFMHPTPGDPHPLPRAPSGLPGSQPNGTTGL